MIPRQADGNGGWISPPPISYERMCIMARIANMTEMPPTLAEVAYGQNLTNLQIVALNGLGEDIRMGRDDYYSYVDTLSKEEDKYLRTWLDRYGVRVH